MNKKSLQEMMPLSDVLNRDIVCECGKTHRGRYRRGRHRQRCHRVCAAASSRAWNAYGDDLGRHAYL